MFNQFNEFSTINYTETNKHNFTINFNITICCNTYEQEYSSNIVISYLFPETISTVVRLFVSFVQVKLFLKSQTISSFPE